LVLEREREGFGNRSKGGGARGSRGKSDRSAFIGKILYSF